MAVTGTYKQVKGKLAEEGFNPTIITDPLFFLEDGKGYVPMTEEILAAITEGTLKL